MRLRTSEADRQAVFAVASRLLQYPDAELVECVGPIEELLPRLPSNARRALAGFLDYLRATPLLELQAAYVETFDLHEGNCLYLTFGRTGDTRRRGMALWRFADLYRRHGYSLATGELPDFLPALLELAADVGPDEAEPFELLVAHRPELAVLRKSLEACRSPYAGVVRAVESVLPRPDAAVLELARRQSEEGPPEERVGLTPDFCWLASDDLESEDFAAQPEAVR